MSQPMGRTLVGWSFFEGGGLKRMDFKETNPYSRSRARFPRLSVITNSPTAACASMFLEPGSRITLSGRWCSMKKSG